MLRVWVIDFTSFYDFAIELLEMLRVWYVLFSILSLILIFEKEP
jgi:hypothetical protein